MAVNIILVLILILIAGIAYVISRICSTIMAIQAERINILALAEEAQKSSEQSEIFLMEGNEKLQKTLIASQEANAAVAEVKRSVYGTANETEFSNLKTTVYLGHEKRIQALEQHMLQNRIKGNIEYQNGLVGVHIASDPKRKGGDKE